MTKTAESLDFTGFFTLSIYFYSLLICTRRSSLPREVYFGWLRGSSRSSASRRTPTQIIYKYSCQDSLLILASLGTASCLDSFAWMHPTPKPRTCNTWSVSTSKKALKPSKYKGLRAFLFCPKPPLPEQNSVD